MNYEEQEWFPIFHAFLLKHDILKQYAECLESPYVNHGNYKIKRISGLIDSFDWMSANRRTKISFSRYDKLWHNEYSFVSDYIELDRLKLQHALLNYNRKISTTDVYRSLKNEL